MNSSYRLAPLAYAFDALEPYIDARTMEIHYTKHHQAYLDNVIKALQDMPALLEKPIEEVLRDITEVPESMRQTVINNGGGHSNHTLFWAMLAPAKEQQPSDRLRAHIEQRFGSWQQFQEQFNKAAASRFGSGWAWLVMNSRGDLEIISRPNQDSPLMDGHFPLLGLDVWEHAYYLQYQNKRVDYIAAWWRVINWDFVERRYRDLK